MTITAPRNGNPGIVPPWLLPPHPADGGADDPHILPVPFPNEPLPDAPLPEELRGGSYPMERPLTMRDIQRILAHGGFVPAPDDPIRG